MILVCNRQRAAGFLEGNRKRAAGLLENEWGRCMRAPGIVRGSWAVGRYSWARGASFYIRGGGPCLCAQVLGEKFLGSGRGGS